MATFGCWALFLSNRNFSYNLLQFDSWEKLVTQAAEVSNNLILVQPRFKEELVRNVQKFQGDCDEFYKEYREVRKRHSQADTSHKHITPNNLRVEAKHKLIKRTRD